MSFISAILEQVHHSIEIHQLELFFLLLSNRLIIFTNMYQDQPPPYSQAVGEYQTPTAPPGEKTNKNVNRLRFALCRIYNIHMCM